MTDLNDEVRRLVERKAETVFDSRLGQPAKTHRLEQAIREAMVVAMEACQQAIRHHVKKQGCAERSPAWMSGEACVGIIERLIDGVKK